MMLQCNSCGKSAKLVCSRCHNAFYCSNDTNCQKEHWKIHQFECNIGVKISSGDTLKIGKKIKKYDLYTLSKGTRNIKGKEINVLVNEYTLFDTTTSPSKIVKLKSAIVSFLREAAVQVALREFANNFDEIDEICKKSLLCATENMPNIVIDIESGTLGDKIKGYIIYSDKDFTYLNKLIKKVPKNDSLDKDSLKKMFIELILTMDELHQKRVVNMDIFPGNLGVITKEDKKIPLIINFSLTCLGAFNDDILFKSSNIIGIIKNSLDKISTRLFIRNQSVWDNIQDFLETVKFRFVFACPGLVESDFYWDDRLHGKNNVAGRKLQDFFSLGLTMVESFAGKPFLEMKNFVEAIYKFEVNPDEVIIEIFNNNEVPNERIKKAIDKIDKNVLERIKNIDENIKDAVRILLREKIPDTIDNMEDVSEYVFSNALQKLQSE